MMTDEMEREENEVNEKEEELNVWLEAVDERQEAKKDMTFYLFKWKKKKRKKIQACICRINVRVND